MKDIRLGSECPHHSGNVWFKTPFFFFGKLVRELLNYEECEYYARVSELSYRSKCDIVAFIKIVLESITFVIRIQVRVKRLEN